MVKIRVETELDAPPSVVWEDVRNIASHVEWMHDAESIWFTSTSRAGVGTTFDCETKVGPINLTDMMEVTSWVDEEEMGVRHAGLVAGDGVFQLRAIGNNRTMFSWSEELVFPWWLGAKLGEAIGGRIVLAQIWKRNLKNLATRYSNGQFVG